MALTMASSPSIEEPFFFDAVFSTTHEANVTVTTQPVEIGANIADHAYLEPDTVTMEIGASDASEGAESNHSVNAYTMLRTVMEEREPISLYTRLKSYTNMMVVSISVTDDYTTSTALRASIMLQKILIVNVATVKVQQTVTSSKSKASGGSGSSAKKASVSKKTSPATSTSSAKKTSVLKQLVNAAKSSSSKSTTKAVNKPTTTARAKLSNAAGIALSMQ